MDGWGLIGAYMVALLVLQFAAYRYIHGRYSDVENSERGARSVENDGDADGRRGGPLAIDGGAIGVDGERGVGVERSRELATAERRCPHCGTENERDPAFVYCRACGGHLRER